ncbi:MAG: repeat containing protein, partial [Bryobacterales bacterium]|nr:repeat containing protein [Bryobacterales bacterium]
VILVNGVETGDVSVNFTAFKPFKLSGSSGLFRSGVNTLQFKWHNADGPGGLAVLFESATGETMAAGSGGTTLSISAGGVVNSASSVPNAAVAPGSLASVYGVFPMGAAAGATVPLPRKLGGLSLKFGVAEAPLAFASASQANVQVPWEVAGQQQVPVSAAFGTQTSAVQNVKLATYAPGIFMMNAKGQGAVVDAFTGQVLTALQPAVAGTSAISIYCTGLGPVTNQPGTGEAASATTLSGTIVPPTVTIGAVPAEVLFSGLAPGFVGLYQINARVPIGAPAGEAVPLVVSIGGAASNAVTIGVRQ